jgi:general secretion pathway protein K
MKRQRGIAVIMAILIVALAASVASFMMWKQQFWLRQVSNLDGQSQASVTGLAALELGKIALFEYGKSNPTVTHLGQQWAAQITLPTRNGVVNGVIKEQQGLYNLNNLLRDAAKKDDKDKLETKLFKRLLALQKLPEELAEAVLDWVDPDSDVSGPGGAEDLDYLGLKDPYRAANRPMIDVSELIRIKGFDAEAVKKIRPFVTALPEATPVNVNTAPPEVLAALFDISLSEAKGLAELRSGEAAFFKDDNDFKERAKKVNVDLSKQTPPAQPGSDYSVTSKYFVINIQAEYTGLRATYAALVAVDPNVWPHMIWQKQLAN